MNNKGMKRQRSSYSDTFSSTSSNIPISWLDCESIDVVAAPPLPLLYQERVRRDPSSIAISTATKAAIIKDEKQYTRTNLLPNAEINSTSTIIKTPIVTSHFCNEIFIERLKVEVLNKYHMNRPFVSTGSKRIKRSHILAQDGGNDEVNNTTSSNNKNNSTIISSDRIQRNRFLLFQRMKIGMNACTRILESYHTKITRSDLTKGSNSDEKQSHPSLLVLTTDIQPVSIQCHLPVLATQCNIPLLMLPVSSNEIGKLFGIKNVSSILFMSQGYGTTMNADKNNNTKNDDDAYETKLHSDLDSFISFIQRKIIQTNPT